MRIGPLVTPLPRRRPQVVAQQATTLDRLSGGRVVLGLGLGHDGYGEYSAFAEPLTDDRARAAALDRGIELLLPALAGEPVPQAGGRLTTRAGDAAAAGPDLGRRPARHGRRPPAGRPATAWRASRWSGATRGRRPTSPPPSRRPAVGPASSTSCSSAATHPDPAALADAGATWCVVERGPGTTLAEAQRLAASRP